MGFLKFDPAVYIIGDEYEICVAVTEFGLVTARVGGEVFYEENSGVLPTEKLYARIRVPAAVLNEAGAYSIAFRKTLERKNYWSTLGDEEYADYTFRSPKNDGAINAYHVSDVHQHFESAKKVASYFGEKTDLYIFNGDLGEVQCDEDYLEVARFVGEVTGGKVPALFVRGNHDTRGYLPEKYTDYFPSNGKNTYFTAKFGGFSFLCLDLGEDKSDEHTVYGGYNNFHAFRLRETEFLRGLVRKGEKIDIAVCHIATSINNAEGPGSIFDIEGELYEEWNDLLSELGVKVMLSGHMHKALVLGKNDERSFRPHDFPIIVGSVMDEDYLEGAALSFIGDQLHVKFTDASKAVAEEYKIDLPTGEVEKF